MIQQDVAEDNLHSCSQQTHYLFDWNQPPNKPSPPPSTTPSKNTITKISPLITSDFSTRKIKSKRSIHPKASIADELKQQSNKHLKQKSIQRKRQVLCRFEYPLMDQSEQAQFWTKMKQGSYNNRKLQTFSKRSPRKKLADLVQQQINKLNIGRSQEKASYKLSPLGCKQQIIFATNTLPLITKAKMKPLGHQQHEHRPLIIGTSVRQERVIRRRSSMPIIRYNYKF